MTISRVCRCISHITSVVATIFLSLLAVCCFHVWGAGARGVDLSAQRGEYFRQCLIPGLLTIGFVLLSVALFLIARRNKRRQVRGSRETLAVYEAIYKIRTLEPETDKKFRRTIKTRNIIDLICCQISLLSFVFALDYLLFFKKFAYESIRDDLNGAAVVVLPLSLFGIMLWVIRELLSERMSRTALELVESDRSAKKVIAALKRSDVTESFFRFKARVNGIRLIKSAMLGIGSGLALGGVLWMLIKRCVISFDGLICLSISIALGLLVFVIFFLVGRKSEMSIARQLDSELDLKARVQTMVEFSEDEGDLATLQRLDTEKTLSEISSRSLKFKRFWVYLVVLLVGAALLVGGVLTEDARGYVPPEVVEPFELSALQEAGLNELISYVENSALEEEFKRPMVDELKALLNDLRGIKTMPDMQAALVKSMAVLTQITYDSSTAAEMLNALWDSEDLYLRHLAVVLDTSSWTSPDWGDFAEKTDEYIGILLGDGDETPGAVVGAQRMKAAIDGMTRKLDILLKSSGLAEDDEMYVAVNNLFNNQLVGLSGLIAKADYLTDEQAREMLTTNLNIMSEATFTAISLNRTNAIVGEYTLTRLSSLFGVSAPAFERPEFVKNGETPGLGQGSDGAQDEGKDNSNTDGGVGKGESYGSDDLVLDPVTGKYVKYGDLLKQKYYAIMYERLQGDFYTEEQKQAIMKYFELLYSGIKE